MIRRVARIAPAMLFLPILPGLRFRVALMAPAACSRRAHCASPCFLGVAPAHVSLASHSLRHTYRARYCVSHAFPSSLPSRRRRTHRASHIVRCSSSFLRVPRRHPRCAFASLAHFAGCNAAGAALPPCSPWGKAPWQDARGVRRGGRCIAPPTRDLITVASCAARISAQLSAPCIAIMHNVSQHCVPRRAQWSAPCIAIMRHVSQHCVPRRRGLAACSAAQCEPQSLARIAVAIGGSSPCAQSQPAHVCDCLQVASRAPPCVPSFFVRSR